MSAMDMVRITQQGSEEEPGTLKADLQYFRRKGFLKASSELFHQGRKCARCGAPFRRFYNAGAACTRCRYRVCRQCRIEIKGSIDNKDVEWICNVCDKIIEFHAITDKWGYEAVRKESGIEKGSPSPVDIIKHSIRRAWTINGPPTRWSASRKSTELRIYRSLPASRRREYRDSDNGNQLLTIDEKDFSRSEEICLAREEVGKDEEVDETCATLKEDVRKDSSKSEVDKHTRSELNVQVDSKRGDSAFNKLEEEVPLSEAAKTKKTGSGRTKAEGSEDLLGCQEQTPTSRVSLIKPPRILSKLISPEIKSVQAKHGERKSNIPIFRRSSKEFEDIRNPQESPKRSLIPLRHRGSTDDLRRSREDITVPSLIPKLLTPRAKVQEERLKHQDSKDDVRPTRSFRRESKDESFNRSSVQSPGKEDTSAKASASSTGSRIFRRDGSKEDVGRETAGTGGANTCATAKGKQPSRDERVGEQKLKSQTHEQVRTASKSAGDMSVAEEGAGGDSKTAELRERSEERERKSELEETNVETVETVEEIGESCSLVAQGNQEEVGVAKESELEDFQFVTSDRKEREENEEDSAKDAECLTDASGISVNEKKGLIDGIQGKRQEEFHVMRRKFSKEEFSNPDDTDDSPNKRCSSHLSPEASPLSTRSSRYSPRESESEPTPALPRKIGGDSCTASQRIRDAITRTRRESNSSARYSSGSESIRLSETSLHGYTELARKVKLFGGTGSGAISSPTINDEVIHRDSATSAGEDEPHDDNHGRAGSVLSQGRTLLRRRRQFDTQGSRRRGRSHARSYCGEELQSLPTLNVIGRSQRQQSPTGRQGQEPPILDYRRLVFISSDSSSGREEDDADSSCSSSSYLNGLPRGSEHAQSLEDCDWDYFESGSLPPLPDGVPLTVGTTSVGTDPGVAQDWSCCPGRGSSACQACGGSTGANVLPVPVPIPVPVPYPVPVPAALWTGDFTSAASSMVSRTDTQTEPGSLRLRGDPSAPWFAWHPRFNQPLHGARLDPRLVSAFDPISCTFRPDQVLTPRLYGTVESPSISTESFQSRLSGIAIGRDKSDDVAEKLKKIDVDTNQDEASPPKEACELTNSGQSTKNRGKSMESATSVGAEKKKEALDDKNGDGMKEQAAHQDSLPPPFVDREEHMYGHLREDIGSSSGRSSADSSDLEDDSSSHRFCRVFVVNEDSLTSDEDIEDNGDESDSTAEGAVTLKRVTAILDEDSVILQHVKILNEDSTFEESKALPNKLDINVSDDEDKISVQSKASDSDKKIRTADKSDNANSNLDKRRTSKKRNRLDTDNNADGGPILLEHRFIPEEMHLANDSNENDHVELKSIKTLDPDSIESYSIINKVQKNSFGKEMSIKTGETLRKEKSSDSKDSATQQKSENYSVAPKSLSYSGSCDSTIIPDSLELSEEISNDDAESVHDFEASNLKCRQVSTSSPTPEKISMQAVTTYGNDCEKQADKRACLSGIIAGETRSAARGRDIEECKAQCHLNNIPNVTINPDDISASNNSINDETASSNEVSSDESHEYEVNSSNRSTFNSSLCEMFKLNEDAQRGQESAKSSRSVSFHSELVSSSPKLSAQTRKQAGSIVSEEELDSQSKFTDEAFSDDQQCHRSYDLKQDCQSSSSSSSFLLSKHQEVSKSNESSTAGKFNCAYEPSRSPEVRGQSPVQVEGGECSGGTDNAGGSTASASEGGSTRFRSVERRPSTRKENGFSLGSTKDSRDVEHFPSVAKTSANINDHGGTVNVNNTGASIVNSNNNNNSNRYRSLVMITQEASYQPVSVITSDTTTLLQPNEVHTAGQGLAGYFQLALEAVSEQPQRKNGPRKPLMVKKVPNAASQSEPEVDSGLSVGSASESDDISVKNAAKVSNKQNGNEETSPKERQSGDQRESSRARVSSQSSDENSGPGGIVILEEGLADDDSWVEEVSHDEDEPGATTATEESSEDEANNLGDREEELRGYHRQAIDFTLHTIVEESCEESEAEPSLATGSPSKKQRPPSASELEKYFFFGLGGDGNNAGMGPKEADSLSETSSIYSEGLESLGQDEANSSGQTQDRSASDSYLNSSRLEKYFLSEFLGFDQDRRDSDGSVGSDSEGRPSPEAQRRKRLVRARGTGRSHSSSLDNLLALTQSSQNLSSQNSLQDLSLNQDVQETQSEGSSTETDGAEDGQTPIFGTDGQFDTVKRKKKKPRNLGTQSPRISEDRNKTPEAREMVVVGEVVVGGGDTEAANSDDSERTKTPQPEVTSSSSSSNTVTNTTSTVSSLQNDSIRNVQPSHSDCTMYNQRPKQQSRDSGFVGSCDDLLQHQKLPDDCQTSSPEANQESGRDCMKKENGDQQNVNEGSLVQAAETGKGNSARSDHPLNHAALPHLSNASLSRKDSFNNWSSDEETNLMMSKMRQFFKTMVATANGQGQNVSANSSGASPAPSPRLTGYSSKVKMCSQNRTKPPQLVYFENELTRLMKTVPGIRDEQVREIVEYLSSEDTWSDSYDSSDYTSSDLEGAAGGRRSALQEQISQSCQQIISKFDTTSGDNLLNGKDAEDKAGSANTQQTSCLGKDTAFVYQKLVQSFTKMAGDGVSSDANSTPHSSPPLIAKVMHHIGSRLVALMHEVSEGGPAVQHHSGNWRRYSQHHRTPSSASTTEDDDSTSDSTNTPSSAHLQLPRSKSHDPLLLINNHPTAAAGQEGEEREASDYERFSWRGSFESALMAADSRTKLSLLACSGDVSVGANAGASALAMAAKRRSAGDLLFNPKSFSREQLDRVRSCGSIGGGSAGGGSGTGCGGSGSGAASSSGNVAGCGGSIEERIWSNRRRSSVPDANIRGESGASAGDEDTEDELEYGGESRATTLPRGMQSAMTAATNSLPRLPASTAPSGLTTASTTSSSTMHKAHSVYHFLPQHTGVKSARYRPPGFARNSNLAGAIGGPKRAVSAPGLQISGSQASVGKRENSRSRRQQTMSLTTSDDGSSLSEACSTPIIGTGSRVGSSQTVMDMDDMESGLHSSHLATRASLSSLGARSDSMASVYSGAGEGRCCRSVVVTGEVEFALQYDYKHLTFEVHVTKCKNLAPVDVKRKRSDPYVKVYLLPDKSKSGKRKTKVKKHTLNPEFNETLKFHMSLSGLETRTLWLTVWHSDMFGRNDFLGEVRMPLENKIFDDPTPKWYPLQERTEPFDDPVAYKGEVIVGLKFVPPDPQQQEREMGADHRGPSKTRKNWSRGALHVLVKEARNLQTRAKNSGTCDPFCKSYLLPDKGRSGKQKTGVVRRSGGSPVWGHTFIYKDVSLQELAERGLELTVWDHDRIASNEFLGGVRFNLGTGKHYGKPVDWMDATGRELSLWQSMLERPNFWVEGAVTLRPNLHNHGKSNIS